METSAELRGITSCWPRVEATEAANRSSDIMAQTSAELSDVNGCWARLEVAFGCSDIMETSAICRPTVEAAGAANRSSDIMAQTSTELSSVNRCWATLGAVEAATRSSTGSCSANEKVKIEENDSNAIISNMGDMFRECSTVVREKITVNFADFLIEMRQLVDDFNQGPVQTSMSDQVLLITDQVVLMKEKIDTNIEGFIEEVLGHSMREAIQTEIAELGQSMDGKRRKLKGTFSAKDEETARIKLQKDSESPLRATKLEQERISKVKTIMESKATNFLIQEVGKGKEKTVSELPNQMAKLSDQCFYTIRFTPPTRAGFISVPCQHFLFCGECLELGLEKLETLRSNQCPKCGAKMKGTFHFTVSDDCVQLHSPDREL